MHRPISTLTLVGATVLLAVGSPNWSFGKAPAVATSPSLKLDIKTETPVFFVGQPIEIQVTLSNSSARDAEERARGAFKAVAQEAARRGDPVPKLNYETPPELRASLIRINGIWAHAVRPQIVSPSGDSMRSLNPAIVLRTPLNVARGVRSVDVRPAIALWEVDPDATSGLVPGTYTITASYDSTHADDARAWRGDLKAETTFEVRQPKTPEQHVVLHYQTAQYFVNHSQFDRAISHALRVVATQPEHDLHKAYVILGRAYQAQGRIDEAIEAYSAFLEEHENSQVWGFPKQIRARVERLKSTR